MKERTDKKTISKDKREGEKGAAMVIVLLVGLLLLIATTGILFQVSMSAANVSDIGAEQEAYNAAESGIQTALNVLRGNTTPNPLIDDTKPASHPKNKISFAKAVKLSTSNSPGDIGAAPRLSRWMNYNYTPTGAAQADRISIGNGTYTPLTGNAFSVEVIDPDNPKKLISLELTADIDGSGNSKTFGSPFSSATITYNSSTKAGVDVSIREANIDLGSFTITTTGIGAFVPKDTRFAITVKMTAPFKATAVIRGTIKSGFISSNKIYNTKIVFDSSVHLLMGSIIVVPPVITPNPPSTNSGKTELSVSVTLSEPRRLIVRSTGYGPRGAKKVIEAMVVKDTLSNGILPATITMVGNTVGSILKTGSSNNTTFSGEDAINGRVIPPIGTTSPSGLSSVLSSILCGISCNLNIVGNPENVSGEIPDWLTSPKRLNPTLKSLESMAKSSGRYYADGETPPNFGDNAEGKGITFVDGDVSLTGAGGGILVTTGKLILKDDYDFNGMILVTGQDGVERSGSGNGVIQGNLVVAPFLQSDLAAGYLSPKFDTSGGGTSNLVFNASLDLASLTSGNIRVLGVLEK